MLINCSEPQTSHHPSFRCRTANGLNKLINTLAPKTHRAARTCRGGSYWCLNYTRASGGAVCTFYQGRARRRAMAQSARRKQHIDHIFFRTLRCNIQIRWGERRLSKNTWEDAFIQKSCNFYFHFYHVMPDKLRKIRARKEVNKLCAIKALVRRDLQQIVEIFHLPGAMHCCPKGLDLILSDLSKMSTTIYRQLCQFH